MPDPRLDKLAALAKSAGIADPADLRGHRSAWCAAPPRGEGLGNQFLVSMIREVDAIVQVAVLLR